MNHRPSKTLKVRDCLDDIKEAIIWINRHTEGMAEDRFLSDRKTQDSVIKNLIDIGEASNNIMQLDPECEQSSPDLWNHLSGSYEMRIKLTHGYRSIDAEVIWNTVKVYLPDFDRIVRLTLSVPLTSD
jgi:uncharacterized protein with HEPN domain